MRWCSAAALAAYSSEQRRTAGSASAIWYASSGSARRQFSGISISPALAQAKKATTCSVLVAVSVATRSPGDETGGEQAGREPVGPRVQLRVGRFGAATVDRHPAGGRPRPVADPAVEGQSQELLELAHEPLRLLPHEEWPQPG